MNLIEIWQPRWRDRTVLLATYKVANDNKIVFTKTPSMPGSYYVSGAVAKACPVTMNGKIKCYAVPIDKLSKLDDGTATLF